MIGTHLSQRFTGVPRSASRLGCWWRDYVGVAATTRSATPFGASSTVRWSRGHRTAHHQGAFHGEHRHIPDPYLALVR